MTIVLPGRNTGDFELDDDGTVVHPSTTLSQFLETPAGKSAQVFANNAQYISYSLTRVYNVHNERIVAVVSFAAERLTDLTLAIHEENASWGQWSEAQELRKAEILRALLEAEYGSPPPVYYRWGTIWSGYDPRSGGASVNVAYAK
jgi:hypothetical protein